MKQPLSNRQLDILSKLTTHPQQGMDHVKTQLQHWTARKEQLAEANASYRQMLDPSDLGTIGKLDLFLMDEILVAVGHIDTE